MTKKKLRKKIEKKVRIKNTKIDNTYSAKVY